MLLDTKRIDVTIGDLPSEVPIWVFTVDGRSNKKECDKKNESRENIAFAFAWSHFAYTKGLGRVVLSVNLLLVM